jgi:hypothetical protein
MLRLADLGHLEELPRVFSNQLQMARGYADFGRRLPLLF